MPAEISEYFPLLSLPVRRRVAILSPPEARRELNLTEGEVAGDSCTAQDSGALPPFLAYASSGNVSASVVYTNYGTPSDYEWLRANNVSLAGKISLVRYGGNDRGTKTLIAQQHGMVGVLIYSDPFDDGFVRGPVYPDGPWRPEDSFQRGGIDFLSVAAGDPLTPGFPSTKDAPYIAIETCDSIPHIPALPLSYGQAKYLFQAMGGKLAPPSWQGGLVMPDNRGYRVGDDFELVVNLDLEMDNSIGTIWNVMATIPGREQPDEVVVIGNHRDAWTCGAMDPNSGSSVMLEMARVFGQMMKRGWRPRRTIVMGSWDGEEYALLGSTEWAEDHAKMLKEHAVAYINLDMFMGPFVSAGSAPSMGEFIKTTAKDVPAAKFYGNETESSLYEQWINQQAERVAMGMDVTEGTLAPDYMITQLGSGSDFTPFYQFLGIISANIGFSGTLDGGGYGTYHSTMDSIMYSETQGDPRYAIHESSAQWWGLLTLRLAELDILPFDYSTYALVMREQLAGYEAQVGGSGVDFSMLHSSIDKFATNAERFQTKVAEIAASKSKSTDTTAYLNEKLVQLERYFLSDFGLPHRSWYKHVVFGPGFYEGYKAAAFPGIADAIIFKDPSSALQSHVDEVALVVGRAAEFIADV